MDYTEIVSLREYLADASELWQFDLLTPQNFCRYANDRKISVFNENTVINLWRLGLLRADLITSESRLEAPSLKLLSKKDGQFTYCDERLIEHRENGYGGTFTNAGYGDFELLFHPFRLYVMYHIDHVFGSHITSTQYLLDQEGLIRLARRQIDHLNQWTSSEKFVERFEHWNRTAELAIALEPIAYTAVFRAIRWRHPDTETTLRDKLAQYRNKTKDYLSKITVDQINEIRAELCRDAEILDDNKLVHVLLRLMSRHERLKLHSALGGCMLFLSMAEIIRRAMEVATGQNLPEEDEMGFGQWMGGARRSIYGSERILDAPRQTRRDFLTSMGLDYGIKVRCYVEGETEFGALITAVGEAGGTEFVNLRGQVVERHGRGLNFVASLKNDMKHHVFSVVLLDQDRNDHVRALRKAAIDGAFFGRFFISSPDFEFANFTTSELLDVLLDLMKQSDNQMLSKNDIWPLVTEVKSCKEFFDALKQNGLPDISKGKNWGTALMNHALNHPALPQDHPNAGKTRPVIEIARLLVHARDSGYLRSLEKYKVDPDTGDLREK